MTLVALRAATEPVKEEAMQAILEDLMCVCERVFVCGRWRQNEKNQLFMCENLATIFAKANRVRTAGE